MTLDTLQPFEKTFTLSQQQQESNDLMFKSEDNYLLETFHQHPHGDFRPTFYNPFEIKHRRRTSRVQLKVLEDSYNENSKPSAAVRRLLAQKLEMTPRGVQIWFQNRRAKAKQQKRKSSISTENTTNNQLCQQANDNDNDNDNDNCEEESCSISSSSSNSNTITVNTDINQSSVLFSQFFTNNMLDNNVQEEEMDSPFVPFSLEQAKGQEGNCWPLTWQQKSDNAAINNDNVRSVAAVAAATAVSTSASHFEAPVFSYGSSPNWLNNMTLESNQVDICQMTLSARRKSCPVPKMTDMSYHQQSTYLSPSWSPITKQNINDDFSAMNAAKRQLSFDSSNSQQINLSNAASMDCYQNLLQYTHQHPHHQLTPPLTASCSASTVAGSPIALDSLYNDPIVLPPHTNGRYHQTTTSPNIADIISHQFI